MCLPSTDYRYIHVSSALQMHRLKIAWMRGTYFTLLQLNRSSPPVCVYATRLPVCVLFVCSFSPWHFHHGMFTMELADPSQAKPLTLRHPSNDTKIERTPTACMYPSPTSSRDKDNDY
eukprot:scpid89804/ scgid8945/ 